MLEDQKRIIMQYLSKYKDATVMDLLILGIANPPAVISELRKTYNIELEYHPCMNNRKTFVVYKYDRKNPLRVSKHNKS